MKNFLISAAAHEDELTNAEWDEMTTLRAKNNAEFIDRAVEL
jgi:hypothetical protein